jgi:hypothetical protein
MQTLVNDLKYVFVYRNIRTKTYSIKDVKSGLVIDRRDSGFLIQAAELVVSKAGRERVLREKVKNVHAGVRGFFNTMEDDYELPPHAVKITYDPYKMAFFHIKDNPHKAVHYAESVYFMKSGLYVSKIDD